MLYYQLLSVLFNRFTSLGVEVLQPVGIHMKISSLYR